MDPANPASFALAFLVGVALHVRVFRLGEWNLHGPQIVCSTVAIVAASTLLLAASPRGPWSLWAAFKAASSLCLSAISGIYVSMLLYCALFHPLRRFPGPFGARLSTAYTTLLLIHGPRFYAELPKLYERYGDVVRIGTWT